VTAPRRVKVTGDLWHASVPDGAVYVGRAAPGLRASPFANPFSLRRMFPRDHHLRSYLDVAVAQVTDEDPAGLQLVITPGTPQVAVAAYRLWLDDQPELVDAARLILAGTDLACWCPVPAEGEPDDCHGRPLLYIVNGWEEEL
jgi:hypothetical protein